MGIDIEALCSAIPGDHPGGREPDASVIEQIRTARREDDPTLPQGEWQTTIKKADWRKVIELASGVIEKQSKDLQVAGWLMEGAAERYGFEGVEEGLKVAARLLDRHWDHMYPELEDGDVEPRIAKLDWIDTNLAERIRRIPLTEAPHSLGLIAWQEAKDTDHRISQKPAEAEQLLDDGKITGEIFDKAVTRFV